MITVPVASVPTGHSLVCRPPTAAGIATLPGSNVELPPALLGPPAGFLRTDARVHPQAQ